MTQTDGDVQTALPAKSRLSRAALGASTSGALFAVLVALSVFNALRGSLVAISVIAWFALSVAGIGLGLVQLARQHQRGRQPALAAALGVLSLLAVAVLAVSATGLLSGGSLQSDDELIATFRQNEPLFARAIGEYKARGWVDPSLSGVGVDASAVWKDTEGVIYLTVSTQGLAVSGSSKGYAYSKRPLSPIRGDLNDVFRDAPSGVVYRHIAGPWYLYYDWTV